MAKVKISDEEFEQLESNRRHEELLAALNAIAATNRHPASEMETVLAKQVEQMALLLQRDSPDRLIAELKPLIQQMIASVKELKVALGQRAPSSFRVQRGETGLIEKVVVEKLSGN